MEADGADIIDIGGESTRPGAEPVPADEELRARAAGDRGGWRGRLRIPDLDRHLQGRRRARRARAPAPRIVNDVSGLRYDPALGARGRARPAPRWS